MPRDHFAMIGALIGFSESKLRELWTKWKHVAAQSTAGIMTATAQEAKRAKIAHGAVLKAWETRRAKHLLLLRRNESRRTSPPPVYDPSFVRAKMDPSHSDLSVYRNP